MSDEQPASPVSPPVTVRKRWLVRLSLVSAILVFSLASYVIYYRYMTTLVADSSLYVNGASYLKGYRVHVSRTIGRTLNLSDSFDSENNYDVRFFLQNGTYRVELRDPDNEFLFADNIFIPPQSRFSLDMTRRLRPPAERGRAPIPQSNFR